MHENFMVSDWTDSVDVNDDDKIAYFSVHWKTRKLV